MRDGESTSKESCLHDWQVAFSPLGLPLVSPYMFSHNGGWLTPEPKIQETKAEAEMSFMV